MTPLVDPRRPVRPSHPTWRERHALAVKRYRRARASGTTALSLRRGRRKVPPYELLTMYGRLHAWSEDYRA